MATNTLTEQGKANLDIASKRIAEGRGTAGDKSNVAYATKRYGYSYTPGPVSPAPAAGPTGGPVITPATPPPPEGPTGSPPQAVLKAEAAQPKDPLSREYQESIGNQYLGTMEGVNAAKAAGKNVQKIGNSYFIIKDASFQTDPQYAGGQLSRAALTAKGYKYLGTMAGVDAARKAGENVQQLGGSYYIAPKQMVASVKPPAAPTDNTATAPTETNPFTSPSSSDGRLQQTATEMPDVAEFMNAVPPEQIDLVKEYADLRRSENMDTLEGDLNSINKQLSDLDAAYLQGNKNIEGNLAPMQVIRGEQGELEKQYLFKRDILARDAANKAAVLQQKQGVIETMMNLTEKNYDISRQAYQDKFNQAMEVSKFFRSSFESDRDYNATVANQKRDDARANLATVANTLTESGKNWSSLTPAMKANIRQLELQAGLPAGTTEMFAKSIPGAKLLTTVNGVDAGGNDIISFVYADKNGNPGVVKTIKTGGKSKVPGSGGGDTSNLFSDSYTDNNGIVHKTFTDPTTGQTADVIIGDKGPTAEQQKQAQQYETYSKRLTTSADAFKVSDLDSALKAKLIDPQVYTILKAQVADGTIKIPKPVKKKETGINRFIPGGSKTTDKSK